MDQAIRKPSKPKLDSNHHKRCTKPGKYYDTLRNGLMLRITESDRRYWIQRLGVNGKTFEVGLGTYPEISLSEARKRAAKNQVEAREGKEPAVKVRGASRAGRLRSDHMPTFEELALERIEKMSSGYKDPEGESRRWRNAFVTYAFPHIGDLPVDQIKPRDIEDMLMANNFWLEKCETAKRVLQRTGNVMRYANLRGYRPDDPTRAVLGLMVKQKKKPGHMKSLPYEEAPAAMEMIRGKGGWPPVRLGLLFVILTVARPGEVRFARWREIDWEANNWIKPPEHTKMSREHIVPLSKQALAVLEEVQPYSLSNRTDALIFPAAKYEQGRAVSDMAYSKIMKDLKLGGVPHGFRSTFRTWTQERTTAPDKVAEAALAHANPNKIEGAYARSDYLEQRRSLMQMWADYLDGETGGEVVQIGLKAAED